MPPDTPRQSATLDNLQRNLLKTRIAPDLLAHMSGDETVCAYDPALLALVHPPSDPRLPVMIELNASFPGGLIAARFVVVANYLLNHATDNAEMVPKPAISTPEYLAENWSQSLFLPNDTVDIEKSMFSESFLFALLNQQSILDLANLDSTPHAIHKIWPDRIVSSFVFESARTIKCDAARIAFSTTGKGIVWAVADTGIDGNHPHFKLHDNLGLPDGMQHRDFTSPATVAGSARAALQDPNGHGTHVAGIIAGETRVGEVGVAQISIDLTVRTGVGAGRANDGGSVADGATTATTDTSHSCIAGLAPQCKLLSLKCLPQSRRWARRAI